MSQATPPPLAGTDPDHEWSGPLDPADRRRGRGHLEQPGAPQRSHVHGERHHPVQHGALAPHRGRPAAGHQVDQKQIWQRAEGHPPGTEEVRGHRGGRGGGSRGGGQPVSSARSLRSPFIAFHLLNEWTGLWKQTGSWRGRFS